MYTRETFERNAAFDAVEPKLHELITQRSLQYAVFPPETKHNAIWDYAIHPNGRHYFGLCAEISYPDYVHFYEYIPEKAELKLLWKLNDSVITHDRTIRPSKIHTCMSFLPDGRIIMTTHTTASAPNHPYWLPWAYYSHMWEGYAGSNVILYDPESGKVEDWGIPVPRETIYGGIYDAKTNAYYFGGYIRGHVYRLDMATRHVTDYGQAAEYASFRFVKGLDGHIYNSSKSGRLYRINTDTKQLEDLGLDIPQSSDIPLSKFHNQMIAAENGPDGRLYMLVAYNDKLFAYDYAKNAIEAVGDFRPTEFQAYDWTPVTHSMAFDQYGTLWYGLRFQGNGRETANWLISWDFLNGGVPFNHGIAGVLERNTTLFCEMYIKDDVLYGADTNHALDPPGMFQIDLKAVREDRHLPRLTCRDPYHYINFKDGLQLYGDTLLQDAVRYYDMFAEGERDGRFLAQNPDTFRAENVSVAKIWKHTAIEQSRVNRVWYDERHRIHAICGNEVFTHFIIEDGIVVSQEAIDGYEPKHEGVEQAFAHVKLPAHPGRQYLAVASAAASISNGRRLVGTTDGMLAIVAGDSVFALGACAPHGPVHDMAVTSDLTKVYGVAGDPSDLGMVFSYDDLNGVQQLGRVHFSDPNKVGGCGLSSEPYCIAISGDDRKLAIGVIDRLGCVYEFMI